MSLNTEQSAILATAITNSIAPEVIDARETGDSQELANIYNGQTDPAYRAWRIDVPLIDYRDVIHWPETLTLTAEQGSTWDWITENMTGPLEIQKESIRAGLNEVWLKEIVPEGEEPTMPWLQTRPNLLNVGKRKISWAEYLFRDVTAPGDGAVNTPFNLVWEGLLTAADVSYALNDDTYTSNEALLIDMVGRSQRLIVTVSAALPNPVSIQYQVQNGAAAWRGSSIQGLTNVQAAGDYYAKLPGEFILDADAKIRVINPLNVAISLAVERL